MEATSELNGRLYQAFVNNAYGSGKPSMRNGAYHWIMDALIMAEQRIGAPWKLPSQEKQKKKIKKYLAKALDRYAQTQKNPEKGDALVNLKSDLDNAQKSDDFFEVITQARGIIGE